MINSIENNLIQQLQEVRGLASGQALNKSNEAVDNFGAIFTNMLNEVNSTQQNANQLATKFESGSRDVQLVDVMVEMQKARVSFEALVQVRNRFLNAYQEIMSMQI